MNQTKKQETSRDKVFAAKTTDQIIAVMEEEDEAAAREKILQKMTPACRKKLKYFETWLRQEVDHTLRSRYELGVQVRELYEDEKRNGGKLYGKNAIGRICKLLRWDDGLIRMAFRFVQTFSPADLDRLCSLVLPGGEPLTWSHVRTLIPIDDAAKRQELLDRTVAEGWTCMDLARELVRSDKPTGPDGRGRPPRVPKDFDAAVAQQQEWAQHWDRLYTKVWNKPERSLVAQAAKLAPEAVTVDRLHEAREVASFLRKVAKQALEQADKAEEVVRDFERILDERGSSATKKDTRPGNAA